MHSNFLPAPVGLPPTVSSSYTRIYSGNASLKELGCGAPMRWEGGRNISYRINALMLRACRCIRLAEGFHKCTAGEGGEMIRGGACMRGENLARRDTRGRAMGRRIREV